MAVSDAAREVIIRVADSGTVREISSLKPCGFANLPPLMNCHCERDALRSAYEGYQSACKYDGKYYLNNLVKQLCR